jgi:hypothetical protein
MEAKAIGERNRRRAHLSPCATAYLPGNLSPSAPGRREVQIFHKRTLFSPDLVKSTADVLPRKQQLRSDQGDGCDHEGANSATLYER